MTSDKVQLDVESIRKLSDDELRRHAMAASDARDAPQLHLATAEFSRRPNALRG